MNKNSNTEIEYWKMFYKSQQLDEVVCSDFCKFIIKYFYNKSVIRSVLDCGCGNGRDSVILGESYDVTAIDSSVFTSKLNQ